MMKQNMITCLFIVFSFFGCSANHAENKVRSDLVGKSLVTDDFSIIVKNKVVNAFYSQSEVLSVFPEAKEKNNDLWVWSVLDDSGPMSLKNIEYKTKHVRLVYIREKVNEYMGLLKGALTIRGIGIGDSVKTVLEKYGKSYFGNENKGDIMKDESGLIYRFYNYPKTANDKYPEFDYIHFETKAGVVVGIHLWRKYSDAP